jgi:hypothetical protein
LTSKENTKQVEQTKYNQSKRENGPRWAGSIWFMGLLLRLSLLCQFEVRLEWRESIQQGVAPTYLDGMVWLSDENQTLLLSFTIMLTWKKA